ncbi:MAG: CvpA family protein [Candidatus Neomarinimicrobiota bacterium]|nr:MAG: CvpA family protein [Candidatus Neomarinimicrobiota bacterium]
MQAKYFTAFPVGKSRNQCQFSGGGQKKNKGTAMQITGFDVVAVAVIGFFGFNGFRKGLVAEAMKILGVIMGIFLALQLIPQSSRMVHQLVPLGDNGEKALGFVIVFLGVIILSLVLANALKKILKVVFLGWLDRSGGMLVGGVKGALIVSSFLPLIAILPDSFTPAQTIRQQSYAYHYLYGFAPRVYNTIGHLFPGTKSFAEKIKENFPSASQFGQMGGMSGPGVQENALKQLQGQLGGKSRMMEEMGKQFQNLPGMENLNESDLKNLNPQEVQKLLESSQRGKSRHRKR